MTQIKKTIGLLIIIAVLSFVASYFVSINIEQGFISLNSKWISNEFALACTCGLFASTIILIATEIQKYFREKKTVEHFIFNQMAIMYGELNSLRKFIFDILQSGNYEDIKVNTLSHITNILSQNVEVFRLTDYNTIVCRQKNKRIIIIKKISTDLVFKLQEIISIYNFLNQAILTDKIYYNEELLKNGIADKGRENTKKTLRIILNATDSLVNELYKDIVNLDSACNHRFKWSVIDSKISNLPDMTSSLKSFYDKYDNTNKVAKV